MEVSDAHWRVLIARAVHEDVVFRNMISLSASAWLVYECFLTLQDEYQAIWRGSMSRVKALYLSGRYIGLAMQLVNIYFVFGPLSITPVPRQKCLSWFIYLAASAVALLIALDIVLMLRVHALYNRQKKVGALFAFLLSTQVVVVYVCCRKTLPLVPFGPTCDVLDCPHQVIVLMVGVVITHIILLFMAVAKRNLASNASSIIHLIVRDGAWVFALIVSLWVTIVPYSLFMQTSKPHLVFPWPMSFMSVMKAPRTENTQMTNTELEIQLTSCIYMSDGGSVVPVDLINSLSLSAFPTQDSSDPTVSTWEETPSNPSNSRS
ncbi:hypothetical protein D9619_010256 [Psilocybe cf. subviscida]|uniref:DUF6533 domain-containing protein n=1 Tax=Psilocybe cf. subviscida TaxID=2480587 RepID=A0A8H5ASQ2_9AGAR|nr:hypothetical protein D9619_010256 [Psilocybe cf. subviscida]